jgi:acyl-CoA thioesterase-2
VARNVDIPGYQRLYGGQLLAQALVAAGTTVPGKSVRSLHMSFVAEGAPGEDVMLEVSPVGEGRTFATCLVHCSQGARELAVAVVSLHAGEEGLDHQSRPPAGVPPPDRLLPVPDGGALPFELRLAGGPALGSWDAGPPELAVWMRPPRPLALSDLLMHQALLAYCSDGTMMAAAMRPHPGVGFGSPSLSATAVTTHTVSFHRTLSVDGWLLFAQESPVAAGGRAYVRGDWFTLDGDLVASCAQEIMLRLAAPAAHAHAHAPLAGPSLPAAPAPG